MIEERYPAGAIAWRGDHAAEWAAHYGGRADRDPAVTLVRLGGSGDGAVTFAAVHSADAPDMVAEWAGEDGEDGAGTADTLPWDELPGIEALAAADLRGRARRSVSVLGTAVGGEWTTWHVPAPRPPVPVAR